MTKEKYAPQDKYAERQREKGHVRVTLWVPAASREVLAKYAKTLCRESPEKTSRKKKVRTKRLHEEA